jgi:hypothetical protein
MIVGGISVRQKFWQTTLTLYSIRALLSDFSSRLVNIQRVSKDCALSEVSDGLDTIGVWVQIPTLLPFFLATQRQLKIRFRSFGPPALKSIIF